MNGRRTFPWLAALLIGMLVGALLAYWFSPPGRTSVDPIRVSIQQNEESQGDGGRGRRPASPADRTNESDRATERTRTAEKPPERPVSAKRAAPAPVDAGEDGGGDDEDPSSSSPDDASVRPRGEDDGDSSGDDDGDDDDTDDTGSREDTDGDD